MVKHNSNTKQVNNYNININDRKATQRRGLGAKGLVERDCVQRRERVCVCEQRERERERVQNTTTQHTTREKSPVCHEGLGSNCFPCLEEAASSAVDARPDVCPKGDLSASASPPMPP